MTIEAICSQAGFSLVCGDPAGKVESVYCGDLLSRVMGKAPAGCAWVTVMGNVNAVAVASLADAAVLVLCHEAALMEDAAARAQQQGINILRTDLPEFEAAAAVAKQLGI